MPAKSGTWLLLQAPIQAPQAPLMTLIGSVYVPVTGPGSGCRALTGGLCEAGWVNEGGLMPVPRVVVLGLPASARGHHVGEDLAPAVLRAIPTTRSHLAATVSVVGAPPFSPSAVWCLADVFVDHADSAPSFALEDLDV